jgi:hypothetical protein
MKKIILILLVLAVVGCNSEHSLNYRNDTPQPNTLKVTTQDGETIEISLTNNTDPKVLISLNTLLANHQIRSLDLIQKQADRQQRADNLTVVRYGLNTLCFLAVLAALTVVAVAFIRRREKS